MAKKDPKNRISYVDGPLQRFFRSRLSSFLSFHHVNSNTFQVFCYVAQRMTSEGSEKTWDQCRIKLKNLKSQYRYVKDRIPNIDEVDLEDDDVLKQLIAECQGRGISPSNIKHLR